MNFKWMWQISLLHLYCSYPALSSHLTASHFPHLFHIFPAVYLQFLFYTSVQTLHFHISFTSIFYPFLSPLNSCPLPLFIYWFCLLFFSSSCQFFGPLLPFALASPLLVSFDFFFLISFVLSPPPIYTNSLVTFFHRPLSISLPSATDGQSRGDKVEKKPAFASEGISIYTQSLRIPVHQWQP